MTLAGTLTLPEKAGKYTAVILVTGSGAQNRDEEIFNHKPFLVIADHLTRNGIAVLRYDDRGTAESTGSFEGSTTEDFAHDALAGFNFLKTRDDIDHTKIGVIGHSEGGSIAFMMASRQPELGFVVSLAGGLVRGDSILVMQNRELLPHRGVPAQLVEPYCTALREIYIAKNNYTISYIRENLESIKSQITAFESLPEPLQANLIVLLNVSDPWFDFFIKYDPTNDIAKTSCPVFALNGDKDLQIAAEPNLANAAKILENAGNESYITRIYPGMNHLFQECQTGDSSEYEQIEQTISPQVLDDITDWILTITN